MALAGLGQGEAGFGAPLCGGLVDVGYRAARTRFHERECERTDAQAGQEVFFEGLRTADHQIGPEAVHRHRRMAVGRNIVVQLIQ